MAALRAANASNHLLLREWKLPHALAGGGEDGVPECRDYRKHAGLTAAGRKFPAVHKVHIDLQRRVVHARHLKIVKITLTHAAAYSSNFASASQTHAHHRSAFH